MKFRRQFILKQLYKVRSCFFIFIIAFFLFPMPASAKGFHLGIISAVKDKVKELKNKVDEQVARENEVKLAEGTTVLNADTAQQIIKQDGMTIYFSKSATEIGQLETGNIIVSNQGEGLLRKITSITSSGNEYVVKTTTATLEEAFKSANIVLSKELTQTDINPQKAPHFVKGVSLQPRTAANEFTIALDDVVLYDLDGSSTTTHDQIKANGSLNFKVKLNFNLEISPFSGLTKIRFVPVVEETTQLELKSEINIATEQEEEIGRIYFSPVAIGPVVIIPEIPILVGVDAAAGITISTSITHQSIFTSGIEYDNGDWFPVRSYTGTFTYNAPSLTAEGEIKCYAGPKVICRLYGVIGPYLNINGYLKLEAESLPNISWKLYGGLEVYGGVDMTIFSLYRMSYASSILNYSKEIASGIVEISSHAPVISSLVADPAALYVNQVSTITCTASDADGDTLTYTWDATRGTFTGSGSSVIYNATNSGTQTITCTVLDGNDGVDTETVSVTVNSNQSPSISALSASPSIVSPNGNTSITCTASDLDGDTLTYSWGAAAGTITGTGSQITWTAPSSAGTYTITCIVSDGKGGTNSGSVSLTVEASGTWQTQTVDATGMVGQYSSLELDASSNPHIAYYDVMNGTLKYAKWTGSAWLIETVDSSATVGNYTSLALDADGNPHISYYDKTNSNLKYAEWTGTYWSILTVDSTGDVGKNTSLALDANNNPHIAYYDGTNRDLKCAVWTGADWNIQTVDTADNVGGWGNSLALDSGGDPHISYYDSTNGDLKYAHWTGTIWAVQTVDFSNDVGLLSSLFLDVGGKPHISYYDQGNGNLKYAAWTGTEWAIQTIDSSGDVGYYTSLALDTNSNPCISYYDFSNGDLKYAAWTGTEWAIQTIDSSGDVGWDTSLELDTNNIPHIGYYDYTNFDLKYAELEP